MSEFTDGLLVLKTYISLVQIALTDLQDPYIVKNLNEQWSVVVFEDPMPDSVYTWISKNSQDIPLLYFQHAEDHGWGYKLFHRGAEKAALDVSYEIVDGLAIELAEELYPGIDFYDFGGDLSPEKRDALYQQVTDSANYKQQIAAQYTNINLEEFAVFGLSPEDITQLREIMRPEKYEGRVDGFSQVEAFQKVLGIEEMSWVSYRYLSRPDNTGDFDD